METDNKNVPGSFRDPSGFLFYREGVLYRQVNKSYREDYVHLMDSGLYDELAGSGLMVPHEEAGASLASTDDAFVVIKPEPLPFISYPYEWCFSQLKDAALATLDVQKKAFEHGMVLKDASAYNMQYRNGRPALIDTLSFERYENGQTWKAYRQFCQHFLAPLALMSRRDPRLGQLSRVHIDGVPLDLASALLPYSSRLKFGLLSHIHLHSASQDHYSDKPLNKTMKMGQSAFRGLIESLESAVSGLEPPRGGKGWHGYYEDTNYTSDAVEHKKSVVAGFIEQLRPGNVWDLGANTGVFSRIPAGMDIPTVSFDLDHACVEENYRECVRSGETNILPLVLDLANPSGGTGWENAERASLVERGPADAALALALMHHLVISNNLPLDRVAGFFSTVCRNLIIEFVPVEDSQAMRLIHARDGVFHGYDRGAFEEAFGRRFSISGSVDIRGSHRTVYLMKRLAA